MRKSINGLSAIVEGSFELDPFTEALFVFCNRQRNRIKILEWDVDGLVILQAIRKRSFSMATVGEEKQ